MATSSSVSVPWKAYAARPDDPSGRTRLCKLQSKNPSWVSDINLQGRTTHCQHNAKVPLGMCMESLRELCTQERMPRIFTRSGGSCM